MYMMSNLDHYLDQLTIRTSNGLLDVLYLRNYLNAKSSNVMVQIINNVINPNSHNTGLTGASYVPKSCTLCYRKNRVWSQSTCGHRFCDAFMCSQRAQIAKILDLLCESDGHIGIRARISTNAKIRGIRLGDGCPVCESELITKARYAYNMSLTRTVLMSIVP